MDSELYGVDGVLVADDTMEGRSCAPFLALSTERTLELTDL